MKILATNDDGISAPGLWMLVKELKSFAEVIVVAPDRDQSAIGTAITLHQPLRVNKVRSIVPEVETYSVEGTPADSVILALGKLVRDKLDLVISGINQGPNLGDDVIISGTVSAALQAYLRGFPALAISIDWVDNPEPHNISAANLAALLAKKISTGILPSNILLNINLPNLPLHEIKGAKITQLASQSHIDAVEEGHDGRRKYYWLVRQKINQPADDKTDIRAIEEGNISITPLHTNLLSKSSPPVPDGLGSDLLDEMRRY